MVPSVHQAIFNSLQLTIKSDDNLLGIFPESSKLGAAVGESKIFLNLTRHEENEKCNKSMTSYSDLIGGTMINQLLPEVISWAGGHIHISE